MEFRYTVLSNHVICYVLLFVSGVRGRYDSRVLTLLEYLMELVAHLLHYLLFQYSIDNFFLEQRVSFLCTRTKQTLHNGLRDCLV